MKRGKYQSSGDKQRKPSRNNSIEDLVNFRLVARVLGYLTSSRNIKTISDHQAEVAHNDSKEIDNPKELGPHNIAQIRQGNDGKDVLQELKYAI